MDKGLLAVKKIRQIKTKGFSLSKENEIWQFSEGTNSVELLELDPEKAKEISQAFANMQVTGVAESTVDEVINVSITSDTSWVYSFLAHDGKYYVKRDDLAGIFTLNQPDFEQLAIASKDHLIKTIVDEAPTTIKPDKNSFE